MRDIGARRGVTRGHARSLGMALAWSTAAVYVVAGLGLLIGAASWPAMLAAAVVALALKLAYFHPWLRLGVLLDLGVITAVLAEWPPSVF